MSVLFTAESDKVARVSRVTTPSLDDGRGFALSADGGRAVARAFEVVARNGPISRAALRSSLKIGLSTVTTVVQELVEGGYVAESGQAASTGGRPPRLLDVARDLGGVLAVDIGGSNLRFAAAGLRGTVTYRATVNTANALAARGSLQAALLEGLDAARAQLGGAVRALAVSIAGIVDPATGAVTRVDNVPGWRAGDDLDWLDGLSKRVLIDNEANLGALGERRALGGAAPDDILFVALGAGIGAGLVLNGALYRGATGAAGEIGLLRLGDGDAPPELERLASAGALAAEYARRTGARDVPPEEVVERAGSGDEHARASVEAVAAELATGIANAAILLNPSVVVLGGGLALAENRIVEPLRRRMAQFVPAAPRVVLGRLGAEAALIGAVEWAADTAVADVVATLQHRAVARV
jgi:predicted NBD/HSP70 family sugar kinase